MAAITALERLCNPMPWTMEALRPFVSGKGSWVAETVGTEEPVAYLCLQLLEDEAEILIFGVHPEVRRQGIGQALLEHMRQILETSGCRAIFLEVRKSNVAAISLYQRFGFRETGMRKSYYADNGEDALVMRYDGVRN